jgi:hypothetical protein
MTITRAQARLLKQTIDGLTLTGSDSPQGTEMATAQSTQSGKVSILDGPIILYGAIFYKTTGAAVEVEFGDGDGNPPILNMGNVAVGNTHFWFYPPGMKFTTAVFGIRPTVTDLIYTLMYRAV